MPTNRPKSARRRREGGFTLVETMIAMTTLSMAMLILFGWSFAVCVIVAGRSLARHRHYTFCLVMAGVLCIFMPFGTVLGVFTIIVLMRPSVKGLFSVSGDLGSALQQNQVAQVKS